MSLRSHKLIVKHIKEMNLLKVKGCSPEREKIEGFDKYEVSVAIFILRLV